MHLVSGQLMEIHPNKNAQNVLWGALGANVLSLVLPVVTLSNFFISTSLWYFQSLTGIGIIILFSGFILNYLAATKTVKENRSVRRYAWGAILPIGLVVLVINTSIDQINGQYGLGSANTGAGLYFSYLAMLMLFIGGAMSRKLGQAMPYQQPLYQAGYQQPGQYPSQGYGSTGTQGYSPSNPDTQYASPQPSFSSADAPQERYCSNCGVKGKAGGFCENCGTRLE